MYFFDVNVGRYFWYKAILKQYCYLGLQLIKWIDRLTGKIILCRLAGNRDYLIFMTSSVKIICSVWQFEYWLIIFCLQNATIYPSRALEFTSSFYCGSCYTIFNFMCMFCRSLFVLFLVLSVVLWFTDSDFGIFIKLFFKYWLIIFFLQNASVYEAEAVCKYGNELNLGKVTKMEGIGRFISRTHSS